MVTPAPELPSVNSSARHPPGNMVLRIFLSLILAAAALFCVYGLVATLEPMPAGIQWTWRGIYGLILVGNLAGLTHLIRGLRGR